MTNQIKITISSILVVVVIILSWWFYFNKQSNSYEFSGTAQTVNGDVLLVMGSENIDGNFSNELRNVEVQITSETKIKRSSFKMPTKEELVATGGLFKPNELPRQESSGSLDTLKSDLEISPIGVQIKSEKNIFGKTKFTAQEMTYTVATGLNPE